MREKNSDSGEAGSPGVGKKDLVVDLLAFAATVLCAILLNWKTGDVIWGLWTCSLCVGYAYIVVGIASTVYNSKGTVRLIVAGAGVLLLAFFTFHFGMFHFGHSVFLDRFFPLIEGENRHPSFFATLTIALKSYWPLVLATFAARYSDLPFSGIALGGKKALFMKPYANVVRMHLLIFVFAGLHGVGMSDLAIYPVLIFYFVPWAGLRRLYRNRSAKKAAAGDPKRRH